MTTDIQEISKEELKAFFRDKRGLKSVPALQKAYLENRREIERLKGELAKRPEEKVLERGYAELKKLSLRCDALFEEKLQLEEQILGNLKLRCDEKGEEVRLAQTHLAKKVKESTLLSDVVEQQKLHILELAQTIEALRLENSELKEGGGEWQEKYLSLEHEWKTTRYDLEQLEESYIGLSSSVAELRETIEKNSRH